MKLPFHLLIYKNIFYIIKEIYFEGDFMPFINAKVTLPLDDDKKI